MRTALALFAILGVSTLGCGPENHIRIVQTRAGAAWNVHELGKFPDDSRATAVLVEVLSRRDGDPATRFYAAEAIHYHLRQLSCKAEDKALVTSAYYALVDALDDSRCGIACWPWYGFPGRDIRTGSVRARALLALTDLTFHDYGFDKKEWMALIKERMNQVTRKGDKSDVFEGAWDDDNEGGVKRHPSMAADPIAGSVGGRWSL